MAHEEFTSVVPSLSVVGNVSRDRFHFPGRRLSAFAYGGAALNVAVSFAAAGGRPFIHSYLGPNTRNVGGVDTRIDLSGCVYGEHPGPEFVFEYDNDGSVMRVVTFYLNDSCRVPDLGDIVHQLAPFVHLSLRRPYGAADLAVALSLNRLLSIDFIVSSVDSIASELEPSFLGGVEVAFCNRTEWVIAQSRDITGPLRLAIVTDGARPISVWRNGSCSEEYAVPPFSGVVDPTGAGDAFVGGFLEGYLSGEDLAQCVLAGCSLARRALAGVGVTRLADSYRM